MVAPSRRVSQANKNMELIFQQWEANINPNHTSKREVKDGAIEDALYCRLVNARSKAVPLLGPVLMENEKYLAKKSW